MAGAVLRANRTHPRPCSSVHPDHLRGTSKSTPLANGSNIVLIFGQDDIFGGGPVLALECCNELVGISINLCIIGHALHHLSLDIHVGVEAIDDSSNELSGAVHRRVGGVLSRLHEEDSGGEHLFFCVLQ